MASATARRTSTPLSAISSHVDTIHLTGPTSGDVYTFVFIAVTAMAGSWALQGGWSLVFVTAAAVYLSLAAIAYLRWLDTVLLRTMGRTPQGIFSPLPYLWKLRNDLNENLEDTTAALMTQISTAVGVPADSEEARSKTFEAMMFVLFALALPELLFVTPWVLLWEWVVLLVKWPFSALSTVFSAIALQSVTFSGSVPGMLAGVCKRFVARAKHRASKAFVSIRFRVSGGLTCVIVTIWRTITGVFATAWTTFAWSITGSLKIVSSSFAGIPRRVALGVSSVLRAATLKILEPLRASKRALDRALSFAGRALNIFVNGCNVATIAPVIKFVCLLAWLVTRFFLVMAYIAIWSEIQNTLSPVTAAFRGQWGNAYTMPDRLESLDNRSWVPEVIQTSARARFGFKMAIVIAKLNLVHWLVCCSSLDQDWTIRATCVIFALLDPQTRWLIIQIKTAIDVFLDGPVESEQSEEPRPMTERERLIVAVEAMRRRSVARMANAQRIANAQNQ